MTTKMTMAAAAATMMIMMNERKGKKMYTEWCTKYIRIDWRRINNASS